MEEYARLIHTRMLRINGEKQVDTYDRSVIKRDTRNDMVIQDMHAKSKSLCLFGVLFKISDDTPVLFIWQ